jgi:hypothetical protein
MTPAERDIATLVVEMAFTTASLDRRTPEFRAAFQRLNAALYPAPPRCPLCGDAGCDGRVVDCPMGLVEP